MDVRRGARLQPLKVSERCDILIIGAGMAGASLAAALATRAAVVLLEAESQPGFHATGRSAAMFIESYGNRTVQILNRATRPFLFSPPPGYAGSPLVRPRPWMMVARADQAASLAAAEAKAPGAFERLSTAEAQALAPVLKVEAVAGALIDRSAADLDVDALHQAHLRAFRDAGGQLLCGEALIAAESAAGRWRARTATREIDCAVLVDAAGAWGDKVAALAGVPPVGLQPKRRTAALIPLPDAIDASDWPTVCDIDEAVYFKPDAGRLLLSPAEETDVEPHDAAADDMALAEAVERLRQMTGIEVTRPPRAWAGLRTFAPDRTPVAGFAPAAPAPFFWLVGQGGYGIQTSAAMASLSAALVLGETAPEFASADVLAALSPRRFERS